MEQITTHPFDINIIIDDRVIKGNIKLKIKLLSIFFVLKILYKEKGSVVASIKSILLQIPHPTFTFLPFNKEKLKFELNGKAI